MDSVEALDEHRDELEDRRSGDEVLRTYGIGAQILRDLGLRNVRILTNNPKKVSRLEVYGIKVDEQIPLLAQPGQHNIDYLRTKKKRFGHILDEDL